MKVTFKKLTILVIAIAFILILAGSVNAATPVTDEASLRTALEKGESVILQNEITITSKSTHPSATSRNRAAIAVQGNSLTNEVVIDGNGNKISTSTIPTIFEVYGGSTVIFKNITIENTVGGGRCIDTRVNVKLVLDKVNLKTTKTTSDHDQALTIGGTFADEMTVEIKNTKISTGVAGYGIITFNEVNLTIENSEVYGYGALYMKGGSEGSNVRIKNSVMKTELNSDEPSNSFGTIVVEDNNIDIKVEDSKILATGTGTTSQIPFGETASATTGNKFTVSGDSELEGKGGIFETDSKATITVHSGVTSNLQIPQEHLAQGTIIKEVNGEFIIEEEKTVEDKKEENETLTDDKTNSLKPEKLEKDDTPKTGSLDYSMIICAIVTLISTVALAINKKTNKK